MVELFYGRVIGWFGELHPQVLENFGLEMPAAGFELDALPELKYPTYENG